VEAFFMKNRCVFVIKCAGTELMDQSCLIMEREIGSLSNWRKTLLIVIGVLVGTLIINDLQAQKKKNSLLWEVTGNGIKDSYVYGTFHLLPQEDFNLRLEVTDAFDAAEQIVLELDMDNPNMQLEMMRNISMKDGKTLDQYLSKEDLKLLDEQLMKSAGFGIAQANTFKPFMVESFILPSFIEGTPASYELTLVQRAKGQQKEILGLESVEFQTSLFDEIPYEDQAADLSEMLNDRSSMETIFDFMINVYKQEDIEKLYEASADYFNEQELEVLLHNRNKNWIPKIGEMAAEKSTFFAVGAGHLGGEEGVISLLKKAGYKVKPVK